MKNSSIPHSFAVAENFQTWTPTYDLGGSSGAYDLSGALDFGPSSEPENISQLSSAEQLQVFQTALNSGLQIFSTVFGAILAVNQQEQTALTQSGQTIDISQLQSFAIKTPEGETIAEGETSEDSSSDVPNWVIPGLIGLGLLLVAIPRR